MLPRLVDIVYVVIVMRRWLFCDRRPIIVWHVDGICAINGWMIFLGRFMCRFSSVRWSKVDRVISGRGSKERLTTSLFLIYIWADWGLSNYGRYVSWNNNKISIKDSWKYKATFWGDNCHKNWDWSDIMHFVDAKWAEAELFEIKKNKKRFKVQDKSYIVFCNWNM